MCEWFSGSIGLTAWEKNNKQCWLIKLHPIASNEGDVKAAAGVGEMQESLIVYLN